MRQVLYQHLSADGRELRQGLGPDGAYFAARAADGEVVGTATVRRQRPPWPESELGCFRVRGMAVAPGRRLAGIGSALLRACLAHVAERGAGVVWVNARVAALGLYLRAGFQPVSLPWADPVTGPHVSARLVVAGPGQPPGIA
jgi:GNAT superfamily N-acetyltransferase